MSMFCLTTAIAAAEACSGDTNNCERVSVAPNSNTFDLHYDVVAPARCPVPLATPGTEIKYAGAYVRDYLPQDFDEGRVVVYNSKPEIVADHRDKMLLTYFPELPITESFYDATPKVSYRAATGTAQFSDYDIAEFSGWSNGTKRATGSIKITYRQSSMSSKLTGERIPLPNSTQTWNVPTTGGSPPYTYQWYRNGNPVGTGSSYTASAGASDFSLRVEVTDQTWSMLASVLLVDVGGVEASITGPTLLYASQGEGTWTASGRGGTGSYTFAWYLDGEFVGDGPVFAGYPGANGHTLRVDLTDSAGAFTSQSLFVVGIGSGGGTCEPQPPALTC